MFDFSTKLADGLPAAGTPWTGFPEYNFVGGHNDPDSLPIDKIAAACDRVLRREGKNLATYSLTDGPQGYLPLREFLVGKLQKYSGISCRVEDILLTSGSSQAMDLINRALLNRGDTVLVEESNYGGAFSRLNQLGVNMIPIPVDNEGMDTLKLAEQLHELSQKGLSARYLYTIPTVHNPSGSIMSLQRRQHLLELASQYDLVVYEDECYADLVWAGERPPALHALDKDGRVVHIGSFSKTIAPSLRVGYVVADWSLIGQLLALKTDAGSGALEQMLLAEYCTESFDDHVSKLNLGLKEKLDTLTAAIDTEFGTSASYSIPPGGIFLWLKLPEPVDSSRLVEVAAAAGIAVNPGREWSLKEDAGSYIRICFANPCKDTIEKGMARLAQVCHDEFGVPRFGANKERG